MSILIKGMDVQNCKECPCCVDYGDPYCYTEYVCNALDLKNSEPCDIPDDREGRLPNCPLVNVPTPHGRLIDADNNILPLDWQGAIVQAALNEAPTVIEAEASE